MNIALIEKGHFEVAYTLLSLFDDGQNQITVFIDQDSYQQLELMLGNKISEYTWVVQQTGEPNRGSSNDSCYAWRSATPTSRRERS